MATNAETIVVDDDKQVTEEDLRSLKYGNSDVEKAEAQDETTKSDEDDENSKETSEEDGQTDDQTTDEESDEDDETPSDDTSDQYVKEFENIKGDNLEDYARNLEKAYKNSTAEALRLKGLVDAGQTKETKTETPKDIVVDTSDPVSLFMKQKMDEEITNAFSDFRKSYPQVEPGTPEYAQFTREVATLSQTILSSQKRLASPKELYTKAAVILGWEAEDKVTSKDKLGEAIKNNASISKTSSGTTKSKGKPSKVTDAMVAASRLMYPSKSDKEIREELEPYVQ